MSDTPAVAKPVLSRGAVNARGVAAMLLSCVFFSVNDTFMKLGTARIAPSELMLLRGCIASAILLGVLWATGGLREIAALARPWPALRSLCDLLVALTYVEALGYLALGDITAIAQSTPILMTAVAAIVWREAVGWLRWLAVLAGFAGVILIARPSVDHVQWPALLAVATAILITVRDLVTRRKTRGISSLAMALGSTVASGSAGLTLLGAETWRMPDVDDLTSAAAAAIMLVCGNIGIIAAFRRGDVSVISPFRYASVPVAVGLGALVWGAMPDAIAATGIALIVAAGLFTMHLDRLSLRKAMRAAGSAHAADEVNAKSSTF